MFDPYAVDISKCNDFYRTFLNVWYGVPCRMMEISGSNKSLPITRCSAYRHMRTFMKNHPGIQPEDVTWHDICDQAISSHGYLFYMAMICFLVENGLYMGEYKEELQMHLAEFQQLLDSRSTHLAKAYKDIFCYDDLPYLSICTYDAGQSIQVTACIFKCRHPFYGLLLNKYLKNHPIPNDAHYPVPLRRDVLAAFATSLDDYDGAMEEYTDFNGKTFWHQAEHRKVFSDDTDKTVYYLLVLRSFYHCLISDHPERDFFSDSGNMSTRFIMDNSFARYIIKGFDVVRFGGQTHLSSNPRLVLLFSNLDRFMTRMQSEELLCVDISNHDAGPYTQLIDTYLSNVDVKTGANSVSCSAVTLFARVFTDLLSFKKANNYPIDPSFISRTDTMLIRNMIEGYEAGLHAMNSQLGWVRRFLRFLQTIGCIKIEDRALDNMNQYEEPKRSEPETIPDKVLIDLLSHMKDKAYEADRYHIVYIIIHILIETPLRLSAACNLKRDCIKPSLQTGRYELQTIQKTSHGRRESYIISDALAKLIESYQQKTESLTGKVPYMMKNSLFIYENHNPDSVRRKYSVMTAQIVQNILIEACKAIGIKRYTAQNIRDTHMNKADLYNAMKKGTDLTLSVLTGHKSPTTTMEHYIEYDLRKYMECMYNVDFDAVNQMFKGYDLLNNVKSAVPPEVDQTGDSVVNGCGFCTCEDCHTPPEMDCFVCRHFICTPSEEPFFKKEIENIDRLCQTAEIPLHEKETMNLKKTVLAMYLAGIYQLGNNKEGGTDR